MDNKKIRITTISVEKINVKYETRRSSSNVAARGVNDSVSEDRERPEQTKVVYEKQSSADTPSGDKDRTEDQH